MLLHFSTLIWHTRCIDCHSVRFVVEFMHLILHNSEIECFHNQEKLWNLHQRLKRFPMNLSWFVPIVRIYLWYVQKWLNDRYESLSRCSIDVYTSRGPVRRGIHFTELWMSKPLVLYYKTKQALTARCRPAEVLLSTLSEGVRNISSTIKFVKKIFYKIAYIRILKNQKHLFY